MGDKFLHACFKLTPVTQTFLNPMCRIFLHSLQDKRFEMVYNTYINRGGIRMPAKKRKLGTELRQELSRQECLSLMDYLMVQFNDKKDYHYNYYFDTPNEDLAARNTTLRLRTIVKEKTIFYELTLKIPTIDENVYLEYHQNLEEVDFRRLAYENKLPKGEIAELTSVHGGNVILKNMIRVNRVAALYQQKKLYFDRISHKGNIHYELVYTIDTSKKDEYQKNVNLLKSLLKKFNIQYEQAERRSVRLN
ncbi:MAG: CYTH domain-containing protein [Acholeplasmatales bacterium]|nr:MAG: CYTH domain-containing protein [Acholeplasmatales bacterium]